MEFDTSKKVFAAGLILSLGLLDFIIPGVILVGFILTLIGLHSLSKHYRKPELFTNMLIAVIVIAIGVVITTAVFSIVLVHNYLTILEGPNDVFITMSKFATTLLTALVAFWIFIIVGAIFLRKAYLGLYGVSGVGEFKTAGNLVLIGAVLAIVLIGYLIILVGQIFAIIGAFELKPPQQAGTPETAT